MPPEQAQQRRSGGLGAAVAAANQKARRSLLRNHGGGHAPVSYLELFFDLVYVFAITQLSLFLHHHLDPLGFVQGMVLFLALWWAWMFTTWASNWANPDRLPVRMMMLALMMLSLLMAVAVPKGFTTSAALFAASYVTLQLGRTLCMAAMFSAESPGNARNMVRISIWFAVSAVFWAIGLLRGDDERLAWWLLALGIEYLGPMAMFAVPGLGHSTAANWDISGSHMAERCALFIIIALGEGIVVIGSTFLGLDMISGTVGAFAVAFASSALMWWLYFDLGAVRGARHIQDHSEPGLVARNAFTYLHMPIVAGIVIYAVADALLLEHWSEPAQITFILAQTGGAILYLTGLGFFKRYGSRHTNFPLSHGVGQILFAILGVWGWFSAPQVLEFASLGVAVFLVVAIWEWVSYHGGWIERMEARGWPLAIALRRRTDARNAARAAVREATPANQ
jgi:low temperature requirement protein LtrA